MSSYPVRLYRHSSLTSWGFRLQGGADLHTPIIVQRVFAGSPAEGQLQRGDILIGIENYDATCMLHSEAQQLVGASGNTISLNVRRTQGGRVTRGQSVGPLGRQPGMVGSSYQQSQLFHQPQHQYQQPRYEPQPVRQHRQDQYNVYVGGPSHRQRSESAAQYDGWQKQRQHQQRNTFFAAANDDYSTGDGMHHHYPHHQQQQQHQLQYQQQHQAPPASQQLQQQQQYQLPSQRSIDDEDVDYSFSQQSVAERMRRFMQQTNNSQPANSYHSVPRSGYTSAPSAANRYRQKEPFYSSSGVHRSPLGEFGWSPSPDKLHPASGRPIPSRAAFEQSSYLPSKGIGRVDSPVRTRSSGRGGGVGGSSVNQRHSVTGAFSGPRYSSMLQIGNGSAAGSGSEPFAYNSRQYNTPINMYSRQNVDNAFEGQTGIQLRSKPGRNATSSQEPAFTQSQVYKMVHEQDQQQSQQKQQIRVQTQPHSWAPMNRLDSEIDEPGVSEF